MAKTLAKASAPKSSGGSFDRVALVLQGGGALGSYQAGVFEALHEHGVEPDWVAGISIGAINSALIAGNAPDQRVEKLHEFWNIVTAPAEQDWLGAWGRAWQGDDARRLKNQLNAGRAMGAGVPGFYKPRIPPPFLQPSGAPGASSYYDTTELARTLERLVDFDRINHDKSMRFSVGAVNVRTGNFAYFDNETDTITARHVMASGALPPAFEAVEIDGEYYWDGGIVSNTPLQWVLRTYPMLDTLTFQVDLWSSRGGIPGDLGEVATRLKEIQFSSRTRASTDFFSELQKARGAIAALLEKLPPELAQSDEALYLGTLSHRHAYNIVQLIYNSPKYELQSKDYEFSRATMLDHWEVGRADAIRALNHPEIFHRPSVRHAVQIFDFCTNR